MGSIKVQISDGVERKFREAAMREFGFQKGALSLATEKVFSEWLKGREDIEEIRKIIRKEGVRSIVSEIKGILKHVKGKSSVELQHEASLVRATKAMEGVGRRKHIS